MLYITIIIVVNDNFAIGQTFNPANKTDHILQGDEILRKQLKQNVFPKNAIPEYPIREYFPLPFLQKNIQHRSKMVDLTPPTDPSNIQVHQQSIFSVFISWMASEDPESGISSYIFGVGKSANTADLRWWQSVGLSNKSYAISLEELGINEGDTIYITIYAINGDNLESNRIASPPIVMTWEELGKDAYELQVAYSDYGYDQGGNIISGWSSGKIQIFNHFISRMVPIIKEIYGAPSLPYTVTIVKNLYYSGSNIFFPSTNEIHMDTIIHPQLLTHELIHAFRDNVILAMDDQWHYSSKLSGFEESFAQGVSYACMNRYIELYPDDPIVDSTFLFGSSLDWDYDFRNEAAITTEDFWSDYGGMGIFWDRYELGAAAMRKIQLEDEAIFKKFNQEYYNRLNNNHQLNVSRQLCVDVFNSTIQNIEGLETETWINKQRIFDCKFKTGKKIWVRTQPYIWEEYINFQYLLHYETFSNGSDWAYWDNSSNQWIYYNLNGSTGKGIIYKNETELFYKKDLLIEPTTNPIPHGYFGYGSDRVNFSTDNDTNPWPGDDTSNYVLNMTDFALYKFDIQFDSTATTVYRVMGNELKNVKGIFGGILHAKGGKLFIDHENYMQEPPMDIIQGAFIGLREWASVPNNNTGGLDSRPGKVFIRYVDSLGNEYITQRNIDYGSSSGNQMFLLNVQDMIQTVNTAHIEKPFENKIKIFPNPLSNSLNISIDDLQFTPCDLRIVDILGKTAFSSIVSNRQQTLNIELPNGIYFLQLKNDKFITTKKMEIIK